MQRIAQFHKGNGFLGQFSYRFNHRSCGIVGLPNVGKSSLFNAITETQRAQSANYPFCTIDPNRGLVPVPDARLDALADMVKTQRKIGLIMEFIDIAGLVKGASKGEGLGNRFLSHIRSVNQILHVVRCFQDPEIVHVEKTIDPIRDIDIIETELSLADLEQVQKRIEMVKKQKSKSTTPALELELSVLNECETSLQKNILIFEWLRQKADLVAKNQFAQSDFEAVKKILTKDLNLLTAKRNIYVCNVSPNEVNGNELTQKVIDTYKSDPNKHVVIVSSQLEAECAQISDVNDRKELLSSYGLEVTGVSKLVKKSYEISNLISFFTVGESETRAWPIKAGTNCQDAAGEIHSDIKKGFIKADVINWKQYLDCKCDDAMARKKNLMRAEGKTYIVQDGDCIYFRHKG